MTKRHIMVLAPVFTVFHSESPRTSEAAGRALHEQVPSNTTPSVRYVFFSADSILFRHDEGLADVARGVPVSSSTSYHGFSVTKTFTALAVRSSLKPASWISISPYSNTCRHFHTRTTSPLVTC